MQLVSNIAAVVTGGASGLGQAVARWLASVGVKATILDMNAELGRSVAAELGGTFQTVDVGDPDSVLKGLATARATHGQERVMVCCASVAVAAKTVSKGQAHNPALFEKTLRVNLIGTFNCASQAAMGLAAVEPLGADGERGVIIKPPPSPPSKVRWDRWPMRHRKLT